VETAVFIGELLGAESKMRGKTIPDGLAFIEYSMSWSYVQNNFLSAIPEAGKVEKKRGRRCEDGP